MYQRVGSHILLIYPLLFDPQRSKDKIAWERFQQVNCNLVEVEVTEDHFEDGSRPNLDTNLGVLQAYCDTISKGDNLLAPERISLKIQNSHMFAPLEFMGQLSICKYWWITMSAGGEGFFN